MHNIQSRKTIVHWLRDTIEGCRKHNIRKIEIKVQLIAKLHNIFKNGQLACLVAFVMLSSQLAGLTPDRHNYIFIPLE